MQGSKPEISAIRKSLIRQLNSGRLDKIVDAMPDKEYVEFCLATLEYVMPKLARTELANDGDGAFKIIQAGKPDDH